MGCGQLGRVAHHSGCYWSGRVARVPADWLSYQIRLHWRSDSGDLLCLQTFRILLIISPAPQNAGRGVFVDQVS